MSQARAIEHRIARSLMQEQGSLESHCSPRAVERLIATLAVTGGLLVMGSLIPELVAAAIAGSLVWVLAR